MTWLITLLCVAMAAWIIYLIKRSSLKKNDHYHTLFQSSPSALIELDEQWNIVGWNANAQTIFGWEESEVIGHPIIDLLVPLKDRDHVRTALLQAMEEGKSGFKNFIMTKENIELYCEWHNNRIDHQYPGILCTAKDITELTSHVSSLTHQACHDPLTGVTNRSVMDDRLHHAIDRAQRSGSKIALFFIDLNDFKLVNDRYGHEAGDKLLIAIASGLKACMRNSDTISRFGGDEFVIIVEDIEGKEHVQSVLAAIEFAISEPITLSEELSLQADASIGISLYPDDATDADALLKAADASMYLQKRAKVKQPPAAKTWRMRTPLSAELFAYTDYDI